MEVERKNEFGGLTELELADFENANKVVLPKDYREFLLENNGGKPIPNRVRLPSAILEYLSGMHNGDTYANLYKQIDVFRSRIPFSTFPIGIDPFGNLFLMSIHQEIFGYIYFWVHEGEPEVQDGHYTDNCTFVAYNFTEFVDNLF
ncbi:SMI1/KNR4 family protein [Chitinophaga sp. NPDC101104]|uniref:SMI1/KNR4 family protein n=1 Tax=Chitinophaga sp. NPDC101104 TaxID=3390561 RepID=UPI003D01E239